MLYKLENGTFISLDKIAKVAPMEKGYAITMDHSTSVFVSKQDGDNIIEALGCVNSKPSKSFPIISQADYDKIESDWLVVEDGFDVIKIFGDDNPEGMHKNVAIQVNGRLYSITMAQRFGEKLLEAAEKAEAYFNGSVEYKSDD